MAPPLGLAALTVLDTAPVEQVALAEKHGFDTIGIRLLPASPGAISYPLQDNPADLHEVAARLADSSVTVLDLEVVRLRPHFRAADYENFIVTGARLGANAVVVGGDDHDRSRLVDSYAQFAALCAEYSMVASLEFMPWTAVPDARSAIDIVSQADGLGRSILIDPLHVDRSTTTLADLAAIPRNWLHYAQLCDGSVPAPTDNPELIRQAREERLVPGTGGIDLAGIWSTLPPDLPISIELPNEPLREQLGTHGWLDSLVAATKVLLANH